jgi:hypothetical protein
LLQKSSNIFSPNITSFACQQLLDKKENFLFSPSDSHLGNSSLPAPNKQLEALMPKVDFSRIFFGHHQSMISFQFHGLRDPFQREQSIPTELQRAKGSTGGDFPAWGLTSPPINTIDFRVRAEISSAF